MPDKHPIYLCPTCKSMNLEFKGSFSAPAFYDFHWKKYKLFDINLASDTELYCRDCGHHLKDGQSSVKLCEWYSDDTNLYFENDELQVVIRKEDLDDYGKVMDRIVTLFHDLEHQSRNAEDLMTPFDDLPFRINEL